MLSLIKILLLHFSSFLGEQSIQKGHAKILYGITGTLQGLPRSVRGAARMLAGLAGVPAGQPHKPAGVAQNVGCTLQMLATNLYNTSIVLECLKEQYMVSRTVPPVHTAIP